MADRLVRAPGALALALTMLLLGSRSVSAAAWWEPLPSAPGGLTQVASSTASPTLAVAGGVAGWLDPETGRFQPTSVRRVELVAASGTTGLALLRDGELVRLRVGGRSEVVQTIPGSPVAMAIGAGTDPVAVVATARGVFAGHLGGKLAAVQPVDGAPLAVAPSVAAGLPFAVATSTGVYLLRGTAGMVFSRGSPRLGRGAVLAELGDGVILAASDSGLVWGLYRGGWQPAFQLLPAGGIAGVPALTALAGVGGSAAYVGTAGFGALLSPDAGYSWYRTSPGGSDRVLGLATSGPVDAPRARGLVLAITGAGLYVHRLAPLPAPPVYSGKRGSSELLATALVTLLAAALTIALLAVWARRRSGLFV